MFTWAYSTATATVSRGPLFLQVLASGDLLPTCMHKCFLSLNRNRSTQNGQKGFENKKKGIGNKPTRNVANGA